MSGQLRPIVLLVLLFVASLLVLPGSSAAQKLFDDIRSDPTAEPSDDKEPSDPQDKSGGAARPSDPQAQSFVTFATLAGVNLGDAAWGDYDADGDLDLAVAGSAGGSFSARIFRRDTSGFSAVNAGLTPVGNGAIAWGDYDGDGDLDLFISGQPGNPGSASARLYRNDGADHFVATADSLVPLTSGAAAWGDYDRDGDLDLLTSGSDPAAGVLKTILYRNEAGAFSDSGLALPGAARGALDWGDYDADGDLDLVIAGLGGNPAAAIFRNNAGSFANINAPLDAGADGAADWGDYDNDGDLDLLLSGCPSPNCTSNAARTSIFRNSGGTFAKISSSIPGFRLGDALWGDFDSDGDLDILLTGLAPSAARNAIFRNDGGTFVATTLDVRAHSNSSAGAGDLDNDLDLDVMVSGVLSGSVVTTILRNDNSSAVNFQPNPPTSPLTTLLGPRAARLAWTAATDDMPGAGLSYNLRVGSRPGGADVMAPQALSSGRRQLAAIGNAGSRHDLTLTNLIPGQRYYWSVQAVDVSFVGSRFTSEVSFQVPLFSSAAPITSPRPDGAAWGDLDGDNDLDLLVTGCTNDDCSFRATRMLVNSNGVFTARSGSIPGMAAGDLDLADFDGDGDIDVLIAGTDGANGPVTQVYRNNGSGAFVNTGSAIPGVAESAVAWGEYNRDGKPDVLIAGVTASGAVVTTVYRNTGSGFAFAQNLPGVRNGALAWGDYDNDGDQDIALTGLGAGDVPTSRIMINNGGSFVSSGQNIANLFGGDLAWGDYDNDGDLDLLIAGCANANCTTRRTLIYRNNAGSFVDAAAGLTGFGPAMVAWADYDADGDRDVVVFGNPGSAVRRGTLYRNDGGTFVDAGQPLDPVEPGALAWADYDRDGAIDLFVGGFTGSSFQARIARNEDLRRNTPPAAPGGLHFETIGVAGNAILSWGPGADGETISRTLSYNLRVGTHPGGDDVVPSHAVAASGLRRLAAPGNSDHATTRTLLNLSANLTYYWAVQSVDPHYAGSPFSPEISFTLNVFTATLAALPPRSDSTGRWGDLDNDGDLDLLLVGSSGSTGRSEIYRNDAGRFTLVANDLPGVISGTAELADFDNDGDLDAALAGIGANNEPFAAIFNNSGNALFVRGAAVLEGVGEPALAVGDFDRDGDADLALSGFAVTGAITRIYTNSNGRFDGTRLTVAAVAGGDLAWGDFDRDGDLDLALAGCANATCSASTSIVFANNGGVLQALSLGLPGFGAGAYVAWGDYDGDGDLDLLLGGRASVGQLTKLFRANGGTLADSGLSLPGFSGGDTAWGDYDADGDLDILLGGPGSINTRVFRNDGTSFRDTAQLLPAIGLGTLAWGDFDNDGRLDFLATGGANGATTLLHNTAPLANTRPAAPGAPTISTAGRSATFAWPAAADAQTISPTLTYNVYVGTAARTQQILSAMALVPTSTRLLPAMGNAGPTTTLRLDNLRPGTRYFLAVQAVDAAYAGSTFSPEVSFILPPFNAGPAGLTPVLDGQAAWGDFDADGDLDVALAGNSSAGRVAKLFRNNGAAFADSGVALPGVDLAALAWGDFDNDNDLDLFLTGRDAANNRVAKLFRNNGASFADSGFLFPGVQSGAVAWGDFDNDGDLDLLLSGSSATVRIAHVFRNDRTAFVDVGGGLVGVDRSAAAWVDYDADGDMDITLAGNSASGRVSKIYRNDGNGVFFDTNAALDGVSDGDLAWGDYDRDGDLDLLLTGQLQAGSAFTRLYFNQGGTLFDSGLALPQVTLSSTAWADFDADGDLDIVLSGTTDGAVSGALSRVLRNDRTRFTDSGMVLPGLVRGSVAWGDFDNSGTPDLLLTGLAAGNQRVSSALTNIVVPPNVRPRAATGLTTVVNATARTATLSWNAAGDDFTPAVSLSYNLIVGTTNGGTQIMAPMVRGAGPLRLLPALGNTNQRRSWTLGNLTPGQTYFWSVQAVDGAYAGGDFPLAVTFTMPAGSAPNPGTNTPARLAAVAGQALQFVTTCSDPDGWRDISTIDFKLQGSATLSGTTLLWLQFDQNRLVFRLNDPESGAWREGTAGENRVLATRYAELRLAGTKVQGRGPTNPFVDITWEVVFKDPAVATGVQTLQITDDGSQTTGENAVGDVVVLPAGRQTFGDVISSDYFYLPVEYLAARGIVSGYGDLFRPFNGTTRGQMVKIIVLAQGWTLANPATPTFRDVPATHTFYRYVETALRQGIVSGYSDGNFRPNNPVTRGQLAKIVVLARGWPQALPVSPTFRDVAAANVFYPFVETAVAQGIISGYDATSGREYRPGAGATRGQIAKIVYLALGQP